MDSIFHLDISPEKSPAVCCTISPASSGALSGKPLLGSERLSPKRLNKVDFDVIVDHEVENLKSQDNDNENDNDGSFKDLYDVDQGSGVSYSKYSKYSDDTDSSRVFHIFKQNLGLLVSLS